MTKVARNKTVSFSIDSMFIDVSNMALLSHISFSVNVRCAFSASVLVCAISVAMTVDLLEAFKEHNACDLVLWVILLAVMRGARHYCIIISHFGDLT